MDDSSQEEPHQSRQSSHNHDHKATSTELLSDAQLLAGAAYNREGADKAKLAGAGEDLLAAASEYGKLDEGKYGTYVDKAEGYLHKYHSGGSEQVSTDSADSTQHSAPRPEREDQKEDDYEDASRPSRKEEGTDDEEKSGGGLGGFMKTAQGFLK